MNSLELTSDEKLLLDVVGICNEEHLKYCDCQREKVLLKEQELIKQEYDELKNTHDIKDSAIVKHRMQLAKNKVMSEVVEECVNNRIVCPIEKKMLEITIEKFKKAKVYNLEDPKVYLIIRSVLNTQLSAHRMQLYSNTQGIVHEQRDRNGNRSFVLNPVEDAKRRADESIITAIEKLDRMISGSKINVDMKVRALNINEVLDEMFPDEDVIDVTPKKESEEDGEM